MTVTRITNLLAMGLLGVLCVAGQASEYRSTKGFRISYPDGWQIVSRDQAKVVSATAQKVAPALTDLHMDVMIINPWNRGQNINVIVYPGVLPISTGVLSEAKQAIRSELSAAGVTPEGLDCKVVQVGNNTALKSTWNTTFSKVSSTKLQQEQWVVSANKHIYIITCTAPVDQQQAAATFDKILSSFQLQKTS